MFSEQLMKYILTYQKEENSNKKNKNKPTLKYKKMIMKREYATVPIRYTK